MDQLAQAKQTPVKVQGYKPEIGGRDRLVKSAEHELPERTGFTAKQGVGQDDNAKSDG